MRRWGVQAGAKERISAPAHRRRSRYCSSSSAVASLLRLAEFT